MLQKFESHGCLYDVEYFNRDNAVIIRFFQSKNEHTSPLGNLVIVEPSYGMLLIKHIGKDEMVISGSLNQKYFCEEMLEDILNFLEVIFPEFKDICQPYHIDFFSVNEYAEYNGEY